MGYYRKRKRQNNRKKEFTYLKKENLDNNENLNEDIVKKEDYDEPNNINQDIDDMFVQNNENDNKINSKRRKKLKNKKKDKKKMNKNIANKLFNKEKSKYNEFFSNQEEFLSNRKVKLKDNYTEIITFEYDKTIDDFINWWQMKSKKYRKYTLDKSNIFPEKSSRKLSIDPNIQIKSILKN